MRKAPFSTRQRESRVTYSNHNGRQLDGELRDMQPCLILQLPTELLCMIFWRLLPTDPISHITVGMKKQDSLLGLIQVCGHWRAIIISVAKYWASFRITIPETINAEHANAISQLVRLWVRYSNKCDLSVRYSILPTENRPMARDAAHLEALCEILKSLFKGCDRWRRLRLDLASDTFEPLFRCSCWTPNLELPRLQRIVLTLLLPTLQPEGELEVEFHETPFFGVTSAPFLHSLSLLDHSFNAFDYCLPWHQLERLELLGCNQMLSTVEWLLLMNECYSLRLCHVTISSAPTDLFQGDIAMPSLRYLHIDSCGTSLSHVYQALRCPMLEGFVVEYDPEYVIDFSEVPGELSGFLDGSPALLALSLNTLPISGQDMITLFHSLDVLQALRMHEQTDSNEVLQALSVNPLPNQPPLLPQLKHIHIGSQDIAADTVSDFLECRRETAPAQLESYHIETSDTTVDIGIDVWESISMVLSLINSTTFQE
jgi:hypothetical protein